MHRPIDAKLNEHLETSLKMDSSNFQRRIPLAQREIEVEDDQTEL